MSTRFASLEDVIHDSMFPPVDIALRRGRHIDREDGDWYAFVVDGQHYLEPFYRRYGCELVAQSDGYFYLLPTGDQLSQGQLTTGDMLVGQTLALHYLDPSTLQSGGIVTREQLLTRLSGLVGDRELAKIVEPRRKRFDDERIVHEVIRKRVAQAIRRLTSLGFIERLDEDRIRLRPPLLRFADPVRGLSDVGVAIERLIAKGEIVGLDDSDDGAKTERGDLDENSDEEDEVEAEDPSEDEENET